MYLLANNNTENSLYCYLHINAIASILRDFFIIGTTYDRL